MADGRFLAGPQGKLRAKLTEKTRHRPYELVRKRMPAGTKELAAVPMLAASSRKAATAEQVQKYEEKIRSASSTFSSHHLDEGTLEEHDNYMVWINQWATLSGFGTFIVIDMKKQSGEKGYIRPIVVDGEKRIFSPEMLVGLLLEMATGSSRTPKGGLAAVAKASDKGKAAPSSSGKFGDPPAGNRKISPRDLALPSQSPPSRFSQFP